MYFNEIMFVVVATITILMGFSWYSSRKDVVARRYLNEFCDDEDDLVEVVTSCSYPDYVRETAFSQLLELDSSLLCENLSKILEADDGEEAVLHEYLLHMITEQIYEVIVLHLTKSDTYDEGDVLSLVRTAGQRSDMVNDLSDLLLGFSNAALNGPYEWLSPLIFGSPEIDDAKRCKLIEKLFPSISFLETGGLLALEQDKGQFYSEASRNLLREKLEMTPIS